MPTRSEFLFLCQATEDPPEFTHRLAQLPAEMKRIRGDRESVLTRLRLKQFHGDQPYFRLTIQERLLQLMNRCARKAMLPCTD